MPIKKIAKIKEMQGGHGLKRKLRSIGIREGLTIQIKSKQPFKGPITISVGKTNITLGRGIAQKIIIEEV